MIFASLIAALIAGFVVLVFSGDLLVRGAAALARRGGVPPLIVGLTIVAFGTSAPEMFVSVQAVLSHAPGLAIGNIVGSNIANVLLVLSIPALFTAIPTHAPGAARNAVIMVLAGAVLVTFSLSGALVPWHGAVLIAGIVVYLTLQALRAREHRESSEIRELIELDDMEGMPRSWARIWGYVGAGVVGLPLGGWLIVTGGVGLADALAVPREFVGLTVIAFGTSLPELATSVVAAARKHSEVVIGNIVGSNIFNVFAVGGAMALAGGGPVPDTFWIWDYPVMMVSSIALLVMVWARRRVGWLTGAVFFAGYVVYIVRLAAIEGLL